MSTIYLKNYKKSLILIDKKRTPKGSPTLLVGFIFLPIFNWYKMTENLCLS